MIAFNSLSTAQRRTLGVVGLGTALGLAGAGVAVVASRRKKKRKARAQRARKARNRSTPRKRRTGARYTPRTAGKRRDTSRRRIRYTKNGQPYVILASGKARFIKKKSSRSSHKRTGGRY